MAAWQMAEADKTLTVAPAPMPNLLDDCIIIEARAVAINPVDWAIQHFGKNIFDFLIYPLILGFDAAGTVHAVGSKVTRFKVGDRGLGFSAHESSTRGKLKTAEDSAFRSHVLVAENVASKIPDSMSYAEASTLPMGVSVAATGLFDKENLGLDLPKLDFEKRKTEQWVLITAGSSSIGACAIQLAVSAGYNVVSSSSPANFDFVKDLGASHAFDYSRSGEELSRELVEFFQDKMLVGCLCIGSFNDTEGTVEKLCGQIVAKTKKPDHLARRFVACVSRPPEHMPEGVESAFVMGCSLKTTNIGHAIYADFLPEALEKGQFKPTPPPLVVGHGLESIQAAMDRQRQGVSARKVVVTL
jgi:NADPH:quinone reductase-like Zn-dependent oxidoreductase